LVELLVVVAISGCKLSIEPGDSAKELHYDVPPITGEAR